jgi:uncharacterized OB-fold protein
MNIPRPSNRWWPRWGQGVAAIILFIIALTLTARFFGGIVRSRQVEHDKRVYAVWCKVEKRTDLTFEEWRLLMNARLLGNERRK